MLYSGVATAGPPGPEGKNSELEIKYCVYEGKSVKFAIKS
jgi:hypothetical protein